MQGGSVLGWGVVRAAQQLGVAEYSSCAPATLILSPCRHMFRCWPEESPAHWGGSDDPTEGGRAGGGITGGDLPLNFQHRSVQDRMSTTFFPSCSYPPCWRQPSPNSNPAVIELVESTTYLTLDTYLFLHHTASIFSQTVNRSVGMRVANHYSPFNNTTVDIHNWNWCWGQV